MSARAAEALVEPVGQVVTSRRGAGDDADSGHEAVHAELEGAERDMFFVLRADSS
jgi:hypothetical protein